MTWKYVGAGQSIPGVPMEDMTDEEFKAVSERYDKGYPPSQKGSLERCGLYEHTKDAPAEAPKKEV